MTAEALARVQRLRDEAIENATSYRERGSLESAAYWQVSADALTALLGERDALREALQSVEWEGYLDYGIGGCAECKRTQSDGHAESCAIGALLSAGDLWKVG